jgi:hypothetical protein
VGDYRGSKNLTYFLPLQDAAVTIGKVFIRTIVLNPSTMTQVRGT